MPKVILSDKELAFATSIGTRRREADLRHGCRELHGADTESLDKRAYFNVLGARGELAVASYLRRKWNADVEYKPGVPDIDPDIQVRCSSKPWGDLIFRDTDSPEHRFVLVTGTGPEFEIRGWIWGRDAIREEWRKDPANRGQPCYCVPQSHLIPIEGFK